MVKATSLTAPLVTATGNAMSNMVQEAAYGMEANRYYDKFDPAKEFGDQAAEAMRPGADGYIDPSALYGFKPIDYYGVTGSNDNDKPTVGERALRMLGRDQKLSLDDAIYAIPRLVQTFSPGRYNKAVDKIAEYRNTLVGQAFAANKNVASRQNYYDNIALQSTFY